MGLPGIHNVPKCALAYAGIVGFMEMHPSLNQESEKQKISALRDLSSHYRLTEEEVASLLSGKDLDGYEVHWILSHENP